MDEVSSEVHQLGDQFALSIQEAPTLQELFPYLGKETLNDPFDATPRAYYAKDEETALYLHSSGSTGLPKAIRLSQSHFKSYISILCIKDMRDLQLNPYGSAGLPPFHVMAVFNQAYPPLYGLVPVAMFTPMVTKPDALPLALSPENVFENARLTKSDSLLAVPTFVVLWSHSEEAIEYLKTCKFVFFGGGPLPKSTGDYLVSRGVNLVVAYGGTEFALVIRPRATLSEEWEYLEFVDKVTVRWVPQGDGSFEAHYIANEHYHPAIENLPDAKGYASSDLFVPHPTNPKIWKIVGRADDVIIHSSGEKTVPAPLEAIITASPA
jgi:acyl-coenzyme A synthetase/AMP-(fatty) acid ligase